MGFAGYPNETSNKLNEISKWNVWDILELDKNKINRYNRAEEWKLINLEWFIKRWICN